MTQTTIPFIDLAAQQERLRPEIDAAIARVLAHGEVHSRTRGSELEERLADYTGLRIASLVRMVLMLFRLP